MSELENKCKPPNGQKMYECSVAGATLENQKKCTYFDKASHRQCCLYIMKLDDFWHCGCCKAQIEAGE
jgi:hypothetical protein